MAVQKLLALIGGIIKEYSPVQTSAGAGDAGKPIALNSAGQLDTSMLPTGVGPSTDTVNASENLAAGAFVNLWNNAGTTNVRNADNSSAGKEADGFVLSAVTSGQPATVYRGGANTSLTGLTPGSDYYLGTVGAASATALDNTNPSNAGKVHQLVGKAVNATEIEFIRHPTVTLS